MKKSCSLLVLLIWLTVLSGLSVTASAYGQAPGAQAAPSVAGTVWAGADSEGDYYEYHFQEGGALHYKSPSGLHKNGTWKQDGNSIYMETNKKFSERTGTIAGNQMHGTAKNIKGETWTWGAKKK